MFCVRFLVTLAAPFFAGHAVAAETSPAKPTTPPILVRPLPVVAPPTPRPPFPVKASGLAGNRWVDLIVDGDNAAILLWPGRDRHDGTPAIYQLDDISTVLALLADRDYEFLWAALTDSTGPDLGRLRERLRKQAEAISNRVMSVPPRLPAESATSPRLADFIRLTSIYLQIGQAPLAEAVMEAWLAKAEPKGRSSQETADWVLAKARLASVLQIAGKAQESFRHYADIQQRAGKSEHALNGMVNHAAALAENGRHGEALQLIDTAWAKFGRAGDEGIAGSERHFAWIRACALDGLGRAAEADAAYAVVRNSGTVRDPDFITDTKETIEWRALWCRRREPELKSFMLRELSSDRPTVAVLALQPAFEGILVNPVLLARLRSDPEIKAAAAKRMRVLPEAMVPALNKYR